MTLKEKAILVGAAVVITVGVLFVISRMAGMQQPTDILGAVGNQLIEQYDPYVRYNGGVKSALPIWTTSTFEADGATAFGSTVSVTSTTTLTSNYYSVGGVSYATVRAPFTATSSVPVVIPNPFGSATTTIDNAFCQITGGIAGTNTFDMSTTTASGGYGSSTPALIFAHSVASLTQDTFVWQGQLYSSSTLPRSGALFTTGLAGQSSDGTSPFTLGPSAFLTLRIATSTPGTFAGGYYTGNCSATVHKS